MTTYRGAPSAAWTAVELEPFTAVSHRPSGTTHLLVEPAPQLLKLLAGEALSFEMLVRRLADAFDLPDLNERALQARLAELIEAGLVATA